MTAAIPAANPRTHPGRIPAFRGIFPFIIANLFPKQSAPSDFFSLKTSDGVFVLTYSVHFFFIFLSYRACYLTAFPV